MDQNPELFHPVTEVFPPMAPPAFRALVDDIKANGLLTPIWRLPPPDGRIVDGRHRYQACTELGIAPDYADIPDMPEDQLTAAVVALNLRRRHLTDSQRAMIGARLAKAPALMDSKSDSAPKPKPKSAKAEAKQAKVKAAELLRVPDKSVDRAAKILDQATPELVKAVDSGETPLNDAVRAADYEPDEQRALLDSVENGESKDLKAALRDMRLQKQVALVEAAKPPPGKYNVVVADPPWPFDKNRPDDLTQRGQTPYPVMTIDDILEYPVPAADDCILWLWTTNAHLADGTANLVLEAWGFTGKTIMTWAKNKMGLGDWLRGKTEHCILAVKGKPVHLPPRAFTTLLHADVGAHSVKPDEFFEVVEALCPGTRVELFGRKDRDGWTVHGAELRPPV